MTETAQSKGPLPPSGTFDPRLFSTQPYPVSVQVIQPYKAAVNPSRRPTCIRFFYAFGVAALVWFMGATLFRSMGFQFAPSVGSRLRFVVDGGL
jgi:hypothetical protein